MGSFHCPMGAVGRGGDLCIECGMCIAVNKEEQRSASDIVRAYLRNEANIRLDRYAIKKIAVCGKGGVGKSTITAMIGIALRDMGYEVIILDMDESNAGLHRKLGLKEMPQPLISFVDRFNGGEAPSSSWLEADEIKIEDIPDEYMVSDNRLHFMMAGKIEDALQGCACSLSDIVKLFLSKFKVEDRQILLVDNEAGVESFGRGVERHVDTIITVVEPSFESINMAASIKYMAEGLGIWRVRVIINKVSDKEVEKVMIRQLREQNVKYLGIIRRDGDIDMAGLLGTAVPECDAKSKLENIVRLTLDEAEMTYNQI